MSPVDRYNESLTRVISGASDGFTISLPPVRLGYIVDVSRIVISNIVLPAQGPDQFNCEMYVGPSLVAAEYILGTAFEFDLSVPHSLFGGESVRAVFPRVAPNTPPHFTVQFAASGFRSVDS